MWKRLGLLAVLLGGGYVGYTAYKMGYFSMPELHEGDFPVGFKSGFKGVMRGFAGEGEGRHYLGISADNVPSWFQEPWSECRPPSEDERRRIEATINPGPGSRFDAVCEIRADSEVFVRGWVFSVPRL